MAIDSSEKVALAVGGSSVLASSQVSGYSVWTQVNLTYSSSSSASSSSSSSVRLDLYGVASFRSGHMILVGSGQLILNCHYSNLTYSSSSSSAALNLTCSPVAAASINGGSALASSLFFGVSCVSHRLSVLAGDQGDALHSSDGGQTWSVLPLSLGAYSTFGTYGQVVCPHSTAVLFAVDTSGHIWSSFNGGLSFRSETSLGEQNHLPLFFCSPFSSGQVVVGGSIGNLYLKSLVPTTGTSTTQ